MSIVRFNDFIEFDQELGAGEVRNNTVRVTLSLRYDAAGGCFITLVSGFETGKGDIVECVEYLGRQPADAKSNRAQEIQTLLQTRRLALKSRDFDVRPGRFHVPPASVTGDRR